MDTNVVGLCGTVAEAPQKHQNVYGQSDLYALWLDTERDSGTKDRVLVLFQANKIDGESLGAYPADAFTPEELVELITAGSRIEVSGCLQKRKDNATGHNQLFVWAHHLAAAQKDKSQFNTVYITGEIARKPMYRETPLGKSITDIVLRIPSIFAKGFYSHVSCIAWKKLAEKAAELPEGTVVYMEGRLQSREYIKRREEGVETLTTWELSAYKLEVEEQKEGNQSNGN